MESNREKEEGRGGVRGGIKTRRHCYLFLVSLYFASTHSFILLKVLHVYYVTINDISYYTNTLVQIIHRQL